MRILIALGMLALPCMAFAATDCRVIEYQDHYEAICTGDEKTGPVVNQSTKEPAPSAMQNRTDPPNDSRPSHMTRTRVEAAINARNKLYWGEQSKGKH
jgi:hypothetical protein